jgi:hypothetical protein
MSFPIEILVRVKVLLRFPPGEEEPAVLEIKAS